jgi:uncharacterized membrane protein/GTPase Era involved in 16S rRNA processing
VNEFEVLRDDTLVTYEGITSLLATRLEETRKRLLAESRDRLAAGQFYVVVCGEFKRGKSSLLNALVERPGLFPVDADVATSAVIRLRWGARDTAAVFFAPADPGNPASAPQPQQILVEQAREFVTEQGNPGNAKNVLNIEMQASVPELSSGMILSDTPGTGSLNPAHTAATRAELRYADAILFVTSAVEPLGTAELDFLKIALAQCPIVVTSVTMIDKVVDPAPVVAEARTRIAQATGLDPAGLVIVAVSSFRKADALEDGDDELLAQSGFPELEAELWGGLAVTCGASQVNAALDGLYAALDEASAPIDNDLAALRGDWAKANAELQEEQEKFRLLKTDAQGWKRSLQEDLERAVRPIQRQLESDLDGIRDEFRQALASPEAVDDPNRVISRASDAMVTVAERASEDLESAFTRVADKYAGITDLSITVSGVPVGPLTQAVTASAPAKAKEPTGYSRFREMWMGALAGAGAGALIGTVVPGVGNAIGGVVGFVAGLFGGNRYHKRNTEERQRRAYIAELRDSVFPKLDAGRRQLLHDVSDQVREYNRALTHMLEDEITARGDSLTASIRALDETARRDAKSRADKERDLTRQQGELASARTRLGQLRQRANSMSRRPDTSARDSA